MKKKLLALIAFSLIASSSVQAQDVAVYSDAPKLYMQQLFLLVKARKALNGCIDLANYRLETELGVAKENLLPSLPTQCPVAPGDPIPPECPSIVPQWGLITTAEAYAHVKAAADTVNVVVLHVLACSDFIASLG